MLTNYDTLYYILFVSAPYISISELDLIGATILLNWNDQLGTAAMVKRLAKTLSPADFIIIVDNGSEKPFVYGISDERILVIRNETNLGYGGGCNLGIHRALALGASYLFLLNADVELPDLAYSGLIQKMEEDPTFGAVGPVLREGDTLYYGGVDIGLHVNTRRTISTEDMSSGSYIPGTAILLRASAVEITGLLDEAFFFSGEIADYCARVQSFGFTLKIASDIEVIHHIEETASNFRDTLYLYYSMRNRFLYNKKHHSERSFGLGLRWLLILGRHFVGAVVSLNFAKARALGWAGFDGICGNFGNRNDRFIKR